MSKKKISISIPLTGKFLILAKKILDKLEKKFGIKFINNKNCRPHINLFSGITNDEKSIKEFIAKNLNILKNKKIEFNGLGVFLNQNPTIYLRFKKINEFFNFRKKLDNKRFWIKSDFSVSENNWIVKSTIVHKDLKLDKLSKISKFLLNQKFPKKMLINEIVLIDYTKEELEIDKFK
ncbi:hypothetical protein IDH07_04270 [Pelagibacterales bacterium SAG-MED04]|nr:hypothetical protein [Pelagibacterales bacterium SAG-MED04]